MTNVIMITSLDEIPHEEGEKLVLVKDERTQVDIGTIYYCENDNTFYWVLEDVKEINPEDEEVVELDINSALSKHIINSWYGVGGLTEYPPLN